MKSMYRFIAASTALATIAVLLISCETTAPQKVTGPAHHTTSGFMNPQAMLDRWESDSASVKQQLDEKAEALQIQQENQPENSQLLVQLGETLYQRCRLDEARDTLLEAVELNPDNPRANYLLGCTYYFLKDYSSSRKYIKYARRGGLRVDSQTSAFFRKTTPETVDTYRAKIILGIDKPYNVEGLAVNSIDEMLRLPDNQIDIGTAVLLISQQASDTVFNESFDVEEYREKIDEYVDEIFKSVGANSDQKHIISSINKFLFVKENIKPIEDKLDPFASISEDEISPSKLDNINASLLNFVFDEQRGTPIALTMLYLAITERMNLPIHCVVAPRNVFVRYTDGEFLRNIDPYNRGYDRSDQFFMKQTESDEPVNNDYMKSLTKRQAILVYLTYISNVYKHAHLFDEALTALRPVEEGALRIVAPYVNLADLYVMKEQPEKTKYYYQKAHEIDSTDVDVMYSLARLYEDEDNIERAQELCEQIIVIEPDKLPVLQMLGEYYMLNRQLDESIAKLSEVYKKQPDNVVVNTLLLEAYFAKGKTSEARQHAKKLSDLGKELDPQFQDLLKDYSNDKQYNFDDL